MFTVYAEKEIFENIVVFNDQTPNWYNLFCNHSEICLNMTDEELAVEEKADTPILAFIMANGGRSPIALKDFFDAIYDDITVIASKPRSAFFLNYSDSEAAAIQSSYGVIVQGSNAISDIILTGGAHKELLQNTILHTGTSSGWKCLFDFPLPPSNSVVITDDWLFKNEEGGNIVGEGNLIPFLNAVLPNGLQTEFHVLIITDDQARSQQHCEKLAGDLKAKIIILREYPILLEIVFTDTIHKRKAIFNYLSVTCDKGFAMFKLNDLQTVRSDNDFRYERCFNRIEKHEGDTVYHSDSLILKRIKDKCETVKDYIANRHQDPNKRILGDCNADKSIKNRLINDV